MSDAAVKLPPPPQEVPEYKGVDLLAPRFRDAVLKLLIELRRAGFDAVVAESVRSEARQEYLFGFGRDYDDGRGVVTNSQGRSWHFYGLAVDIVSRAQGWDAPASFWRALEVAAENEGLTSGADWDRNDATQSRLKDLPHVQWGPPMRRSPSPRAYELWAEGGNQAVWREVGAGG